MRHSLLFLLITLAACSPSAAPAPAPPQRGQPTAMGDQLPHAPDVTTAAPQTIPAAGRTDAPQEATRPTAPPAVPVPARSATPAPPAPPPQPAAYSYPIGRPSQPPGDGFFIRHGFMVENTWYNPGHWHTGEDWYAVDDADTAGARVYAIADGVVVFAGGNYPGRVVILEHADQLFSMYGHLDPALAVHEGQHVARGELIGTVLRRGDAIPNHLHFEVRTFLVAAQINGAAPRYRFRCGINCPPGPGYWPFDAPDLPGQVGWRNPTHVIARRAFAPAASGRIGEVVVATRPVSPAATLWAAPPPTEAPQALGELALQPGARYPLLAVHAGVEAPDMPTALSYQLWYRLALPDGRSGWVQAAVATPFETGADGRPSTISFNFFPVISAVP